MDIEFSKDAIHMGSHCVWAAVESVSDFGFLHDSTHQPNDDFPFGIAQIFHRSFWQLNQHVSLAEKRVRADTVIRLRFFVPQPCLEIIFCQKEKFHESQNNSI